ncbi:MAG: ABC transporter permease subunit, partial [Enterococcus sp.]|nr:ABC transporter permease subunit [Enterococcus sp.]
MFSKPIFKQSIRSNWKLWVIITIVASVILSGFIMGYDAAGYASIAAASEGTVFSNILSSMTSLLGSLENFYKLIAVILGIVYVVFTANNLVVNEVDSGSMAYTLSTPIKRSSVIFTKSLYLIVSVVLMYAIVSVAGLGASQLKYGNVTGYAITDDVTAAADVLNVKERYLSERLYLIKEDERAMREAAVARNMDTEAYAIYLADAIKYRSYEEAAVIITNERRDRYAGDKDMTKDDIEITTDELVQNPAMILESNDALAAGARVQGGSINDYHQFIVEEITALELKKNADAKATTNEENKDTETQTQPQVVVTPDNTEHLLQAVVDSTSRTLGIKSSQISDNLTLIKDPKA